MSGGGAAEERQRSREGAEEERTHKIAYAHIIDIYIYIKVCSTIFISKELLANVDSTFNMKQIPDLKEMLTLE